MPTYNYVSEQGKISSFTTSYSWKSLCHNEDMMDGWNMFIEIGGFGWSVCRLCGKEVSFIKKWEKCLNNN